MPLQRSATGGVGGGPYPSIASNSTSQWIPQIWSGLMVEKFYPATVVGDFANTDYQGEISKYGDSVVIRTTPDISIVEYEVGMDLDYENPESPSTLLEINRGFSFSFAIESVDKYQSDIDLISDWSEDASHQLATRVDSQILAGDGVNPGIYADADPLNQGANAGAISQNINLGVAGTPRVVTKADVLDWVVDLGTVLDEQNVPETDRCLILPARITGLIKKSDLRDASLAGDDTSIVRNGRLGMIDRFMLYHSNLLDYDVAAGEYNIIAGHKSALTFAAQMDDEKLVHMLNPRKHGELIRGLMVYGFEVIKPESLVWSVAQAA